MKYITLVFASFLLATTLQAQEINATVTVLTPKLQTADPKVFDNLKQNIQDFYNNQKWTSDVFEPDERIKCNIQVTITKELSATAFKAELSIQSVRPAYGSTYETQLFNHLDKDLTFTYEQFQPLQYTQNSFSDNLSSTLAYYAYIMLGTDYDSFVTLGGESYFQTAQDILNTVPTSLGGGQRDAWQSDKGSRNRYWLIENFLRPTFRSYREAMYTYHRKGIDVAADNVEGGRSAMLQALEEVDKVNASSPNSMIVQLFVNAKWQELLEVYKPSGKIQKSRVYDILSRVDPSNITRYQVLNFL
jgi:Domain of unknown function (DUF4835)